MEPLRILHVASEAAPFAKTGGLADVVAGLSHYLAGAGHDVRVLLPDYLAVRRHDLILMPVAAEHRLELPGGSIDFRFRRLARADGEPEFIFLDCPVLFGRGGIYGPAEGEAQRFLLLCQAALQLCHDLDWAPQIVHCHDWHTGLLPLLLRHDLRYSRLFSDSQSVLTIHNIGYQGSFPATVLDEAGLGWLHAKLAAAAADTQVNFLQAGIRSADALTTVSPTHAQEIRTPAYGMGLDGELKRRSHRLVGILNGADYGHWNPATDTLIPARFAAEDLAGKAACKHALAEELGLEQEPGAPLLGLVSRLADQKGIDLVLAVLPALLGDYPLTCAVLGDGDPQLVQALKTLVRQHPGRIAFVEGYDEPLAHRIVAGSDLFLVPSRYEPCGLTQMYAMRYGTVPVVRQTGGLADTVQHFNAQNGSGTGSVFKDADPGGLRWALDTALGWYREPGLWRQLQANGMAADFSWTRQGPHYANLYRQLLTGAP